VKVIPMDLSGGQGAVPMDSGRRFIVDQDMRGGDAIALG
jgi:hypothetical protein